MARKPVKEYEWLETVRTYLTARLNARPVQTLIDTRIHCIRLLIEIAVANGQQDI